MSYGISPGQTAHPWGAFPYPAACLAGLLMRRFLPMALLLREATTFNPFRTPVLAIREVCSFRFRSRSPTDFCISLGIQHKWRKDEKDLVPREDRITRKSS